MNKRHQWAQFVFIVVYAAGMTQIWKTKLQQLDKDML